MLGPGTRIAGKYELESRLGKGGMGEVWLARHVALGERRVAIKFLLNSLSPELLERFHREARIASKIRTRHVVEVVDFGEHQGAPFLVMEHLEGRELRTLLEERGRLDPASTIEILLQVAKGLQKAHEAGLIHRDIKPENLFLTKNEDGHLLLKILDFGIAKSVATEPQTATGAMIGTVYYMSPEQFQGMKGIDHRTDLWSLACVAYEMLVGERVFTGDSVLMIGMQLLGTERPVPSRRAPGMPRAFDAWFAKALHPVLAKRFSSAQELMTSLANALGVHEDSVNLFLSSSSPTIGTDTSEPVSAMLRMAAPRRRLPLVLWLPLLAAVVVVTAAISFALRPDTTGQPLSAAASFPSAGQPREPVRVEAIPSVTASASGELLLIRAVALADQGRVAEAHLLVVDLPANDPVRSDDRFTSIENAWADRLLDEAKEQRNEQEKARMLRAVVLSGADEERRARAQGLLDGMTRPPPKPRNPPTRTTKHASTKTEPTATAAPPAATDGSLPSRF